MTGMVSDGPVGKIGRFLPRYFYAASLALGLGGGFRPELSLILLPLWAWVGWQAGRWRLLLRGAGLYALATLAWIGSLVLLSGGPARLLFTFREYLNAQTFQTSALGGLFAPGWRRMLGRAILWNSLGMLPLIWTIPFGWLKRAQWPDWKPSLLFSLLWFLPAFLFSVIVHIAAPDHALATVPVVCLIGAACICAAEQSLSERWVARLKNRELALCLLLSLPALFLYGTARLTEVELVLWIAVLVAMLFLLPLGAFPKRGPLVYLALVANIVLFFGRFPFPQGPAAGAFRGLASVKDAFLGATYESSYNRVQWTDEISSLSFENISWLKAGADRPLLIIWSRDAAPVWRKISYYFPSEKVLALDERGDPGVTTTLARLWSGKRVLAAYSGDPPIRIPVPRGARIIWLLAGGVQDELGQVVTLRKSPVQFYTDLEPDAPSFRFGSFEFVPQ